MWAAFAVAWIAGIALVGWRASRGLGLIPTGSLVERFGLFTIIVLGEVVFGVVDGLSSAERDALTITTGMLALWMGFGLWWIYFDLVGRRLPRDRGGAVASWVLGHLPLTLSIAAAGAGMVSLIGHAHDARTPTGTAWLLAGAVATGLLALTLIERALADAERLFSVFQPLGMTTTAAAHTTAFTPTVARSAAPTPSAESSYGNCAKHSRPSNPAKFSSPKTIPAGRSSSNPPKPGALASTPPGTSTSTITSSASRAGGRNGPSCCSPRRRMPRYHWRWTISPERWRPAVTRRWSTSPATTRLVTISAANGPSLSRSTARRWWAKPAATPKPAAASPAA
ncbi:MAG TPA: low temperature requirement protein A [Chloroflexota bacterium]